MLPLLILLFWLKNPASFEDSNIGEKKFIPNEPSYGFFLSSFGMFVYWLRARPINLLPGNVPNPFETSGTFIFYVCIVAISFFSVFCSVAKNRLKKKSMISWAVVCGLPYVLGSGYGINELFDLAPATSINGNIIKKTKSGDRHRTYSLSFRENLSGEVREYTISRNDFDLVNETGGAVIIVKPGLLSVPWLAGIEPKLDH